MVFVMAFFFIECDYMYPCAFSKYSLTVKTQRQLKFSLRLFLKAQENQRFSMVTKLKLRTLKKKRNRLTTNYCAFAFNFSYNAL